MKHLWPTRAWKFSVGSRLLLGVLLVLGVTTQALSVTPAGATGPKDAPVQPRPASPAETESGRRSVPIPPELVGTEPAPVPAAQSSRALDSIACIGNGTSGKRVQLVYAYRAGSANRSATFATSVRTWATQFDEFLAGEAAATGGNRRIRFVHDGACQPTITTVRVPSNATDYYEAVEAIEAAGLSSSDRKYLVYADWNLPDLCGQGTFFDDEDPTASNLNNTQVGYAFSYLSCWDWGTSNTALHELFHNLGAVQAGSPNGNGAHCDDGTLDGADIMCYGEAALDACDASGPRIMDCARDDYFNVSPVPGSYLATHWNTAKSSYLEVPGGCAPQDAFAKSYPIGGTRGAIKGSNVDCTVEAGEPSHAGHRSRSVWWTYTAPSNGQVTVDTLGSTFDTVLAVYTGNSVGGLTPVASNDDTAPGRQSRVAFLAAAGQQYRIAVDGKASASGAIALQWRHAASPANDNLADAPVVSGASGSATGSSVGATRETGEPMHRRRGFPSVWWSWTAPVTGTLRLNTAGSNFDTVLNAYTGNNAGALVAKAQNDDTPVSFTSEVLMPVKAGVTYRWAVSGYAGYAGAVKLNWNLQPVQCAVGAANPFSDVAGSAWYRTPVLWLVQQGITTGTSPGIFSPDAPVTRGQMAVFLWRTAGQPTAFTPQSFNDVPRGSYADKAVAWLAEQEITTGTRPGYFSPNDQVTRAQMATFLWRMIGSVYPGFDHGFWDVYTDSFANKSVAWLVREGITAGTTPDEFSPNQKVSRAQMAVFLNRRACG
ncbi:MAG: S-layer homology domain-containing protein [Candidatus Microthrix sp.]|nr:S-layer homology domain-containing protein [Candidatus Microthrix sp.]MBK6439417.1 S-layer homology domain-containing protein [Candidatus Microthrix sp.]